MGRREELNAVARRTTYHLKQVAKVGINYQGRRRFWLRQEFFDVVRAMTPSVAVETDGIRYYMDTSDLGLGRILFGQGSFEQDVMGAGLELAADASGRRPLLAGRTFVDVGANIGTSTVPAIKVFGAERGVAFEPEPGNFKLLQCNLVANDLYERVRALPVALSDHPGTATLELATASSSDHRIRRVAEQDDGPFQESRRTTTEIDVARFDDVAADLGLGLDEIGMVWMDTQGHEAHVLAGAATLLRSSVPVLLEYWPYGLRRAAGLDLLNEIIADHYRRVIDVRASMGTRSPVEHRPRDIAHLEDLYVGQSFTDLVLLK